MAQKLQLKKTSSPQSGKSWQYNDATRSNKKDTTHGRTYYSKKEGRYVKLPPPGPSNLIVLTPNPLPLPKNRNSSERP